MLFELLHAPFPEGYGEALLPMVECKQHLRVMSEDEDDLIAVLRDAAIEFVERYCSVKLGPSEGLQWLAEGFPCRPTLPVSLSVKPVTAITGMSWLGAGNIDVIGPVSDFRFSSGGEVRPISGGAWPSGVAGSVAITFNAGYAPGAAPRSLLAAARMFLGHLWMHREAVVDSGSSGEVPFGVRQLCVPFRRVLI